MTIEELGSAGEIISNLDQKVWHWRARDIKVIRQADSDFPEHEIVCVVAWPSPIWPGGEPTGLACMTPEIFYSLTGQTPEPANTWLALYSLSGPVGEQGPVIGYTKLVYRSHRTGRNFVLTSPG